IWSLTRMPAGRPAGMRAIVAARSRTSASMAQPCSYVNRIGARMASIERQTGLSLSAGERAISHVPPEGSDFGLEQYKLDRAHELELNKATAEYEHAWIRTITLLNGGAAVGFVTLISAIWKV